jgi:putative flippase GtrA
MIKTFVKHINRFLDLFYPIFSNFLNKQTYLYIACGGTNTLLGLILFYYFENFIFHQKSIDIGFEIHAHIAAFILSFLITFPIGFFLSKFVVWDNSELAGKKQLFRHLVFVVISVFLNYGLLKLFVEIFDWWPFPSQFLTTAIIVVFSYLTQKFISFK